LDFQNIDYFEQCHTCVNCKHLMVLKFKARYGVQFAVIMCGVYRATVERELNGERCSFLGTRSRFAQLMEINRTKALSNQALIKPVIFYRKFPKG